MFLNHEDWTQLRLPVAAMAVIVVASNILVQHPLNPWLTWGAIVYPVSFLVTDLCNRRFGPARTRKVVYVGFALAVVLSGWLAGWRIAMASGSAFLAAQLLDVAVFDRLRRQQWWRAPLASSLLAAGLDTALFFSLAFYGTPMPWVTLAIGDFLIKAAIALAMLLPFRALMRIVPSQT